ncbi:GSCFA domain-containing protein [Terrimonas sp.]|uniref:GSCFA domain-containing protein n=1 Tax=Terrimonas sp. TaxID=1914338 RepID=UPI000D524316|nr:GSCFA domain-containing protein [Terrimonas sp.]PVD52354.1 GSCFA domain-containing protein [Terrimonas sp.]
MDFRLEFDVKPFVSRIQHNQKIMLTGSCFTEHIANYLFDARFNILSNPNGILFNPSSITSSVISYIEKQTYTEAALFYFNESWHSWDYHSRFSGPDKEKVLEAINNSQAGAHEFLKTADWLIITLGSAFGYEWTDKTGELHYPANRNSNIVANCHKVPTDKFKKRLLSVEEILAGLDEMIYRLSFFNPGIKIIFTISPVRHIRDGFVENNKSKAVLIQCVHQLVEKFDRLFYFPAYELVLDDLRDYRFFAEDMVHPNYFATQYVWEKFTAACIDPSAYTLMKEIQKINIAFRHRPFNPGSTAHKQFLQSNLNKIQSLTQAYPYLDFAEEMKYFEGK